MEKINFTCPYSVARSANRRNDEHFRVPLITGRMDMKEATGEAEQKKEAREVKRTPHNVAKKIIEHSRVHFPGK